MIPRDPIYLTREIVPFEVLGRLHDDLKRHAPAAPTFFKRLLLLVVRELDRRVQLDLAEDLAEDPDVVARLAQCQLRDGLPRIPEPEPLKADVTGLSNAEIAAAWKEADVLSLATQDPVLDEIYARLVLDVGKQAYARFRLCECEYVEKQPGEGD